MANLPGDMNWWNGAGELIKTGTAPIWVILVTILTILFAVAIVRALTGRSPDADKDDD